MNKQCYCLIYSRTHGELQVVSELARSCSTAPGQRRGIGASRLWVTVRRAVWLLGAALFAGQALADGIIADRQVAPVQRPEVITTQNGLPQVNINAPNQAGVSHNPYQQFDVDQRGAILNNSSLMTSTQLAGIIQGNPRLDPNAVPARFIINEVNSDKPSQLRGFLEVAGGRAQVIVANPSGIVCNGCGTINAGRMTLTTGKPQLNADGSLAGYQVERGVVSIEGGGLNGDPRHDAGYVDILARAVKLNAGVWAKEEIAVVAGRNRISVDSKTVTPLAAEGKKPELAIDMGQMGGMYSGYIRMIGTEAGVGVRNQGGHLQAGKTLTVSSEGRLSWQSGEQEAITQAGGDITLTAGNGLEHHGKLHSGGQLAVQSRDGDIQQSGTLAAVGDIRLTSARGIQSRGYLLAGSDINSTLKHKANLTLNSQENTQANGHLLSLGNIKVTGQRVDISQSQLAASSAEIAAQAGGVALQQAKIDSQQLTVKTPGDIDAQQARVAVGRWEIDANNLFNQKAVWSQTGVGESRFALAGALDNTGGRIEAPQLSLNAGSLNNQQGHLVAFEKTVQHWRVTGLLNNTDGLLGNNGNLRLDIGSLNNQRGTLKSQSALDITSGADINNTKGQLLSEQPLTVKASGSINNLSGEIRGEHLLLTAQNLTNTEGKVVSKGRLKLDILQTIDNQRGLLDAADALDIRTQSHWDNRGGTAQGSKQVDVSAHHINNSDGTLLTGQTLTVNTTGNIDNQRGTLQSQSVINITSGADIQNGQGKLLADQALTLKAAGSIDNRSGNIRGKELVLTAQNLTNTEGKVVSKGQLKLDTQQAINNQHGLFDAADDLDIRTRGHWDNRSGIAQSGKQVDVTAHSIDNSDGTLLAEQALTVNTTGTVDNQRGTLQGLSALNVTSGGDIQNGQGKLLSDQALTLKAAGSVDNQSGNIQGKALELTAQMLTNTKGKIVSQGHLQLEINQDIDNQYGLIQADDALKIHTDGHWDNRGGTAQGNEQVDVSARSIDNSGGTLSAEQKLTLNAADNINNQSGDIRGEVLQLTAQHLNNAQGKIVSKGHFLLDSHQSIDNQHGLLDAADALDIRTQGVWDNRSGTAQSGRQVDVSAQRINNSDGKLLADQALTITTGNSIDNQRGTLQGLSALNVTSGGDIQNDQGNLLSGQALTVKATGSVDNQSGNIQGEALELTAQKLTNTKGKIVSKGYLQLEINQDIDNQHGLIKTDEALKIHTDGHWNNHGGTLQGGKQVDVSARSIDNSGGKLSAKQKLTLNVADNINNQSGDIRGEVLQLMAQHLNNAQGKIVSKGHFLLDSHQSIDNQHGLLDAADALDIRTQGLWDNRSGTVQGGKQVDVSAQRIDNSDGKLLAEQTLTVNTTGNIDNQRGTLQGLSALSVTSGGDIQNGEGKLLSDQALTLKAAGSVDNQSGNIQGEALELTAQTLTNTKGKIVSQGHLQLEINQDIDNQHGLIQADDTLDIHADGHWNNHGGSLQGGKQVDVSARSIDNSGGTLSAAQALTLNADENIDNQSGDIQGEHLQLTASRLDNTKGKVISKGRLKLDIRQAIDNRHGLFEATDALDIRTQGNWDNRNGIAQGGRQVDISALHINNSDGKLLADQALTVNTTGTIDNQRGMLQGLSALHVTSGGDLQNGEGKLFSEQQLTVKAAGSIDNQSGYMQGNYLQLTAQHLKNTLGNLVSLGNLQFDIQQSINNQQGFIEAGDTLDIHTDGHWDNRGGTAQGGKQVTVSTHSMDNTGGKLQSVGDLTLNSTGDIINQAGKLSAQQHLHWQGGTDSLLNNDAGTLFSEGRMSLWGGQLTNREKGEIRGKQGVKLDLTGRWDNQGGKLTSSGYSTVNALSLLNAQGKIEVLDALDMRFTQTLDNSKGHIFSKLAQSLRAENILNTQGWTGTQRGWSATAERFDNQEGSVSSLQDATLAVSTLDNQKGTLVSAGALMLRSAQVINNQGGKISALKRLDVQGATEGSAAGRVLNAGGKLLSDGTLSVTALSLDNINGLIDSQQPVRLHLSGRLDNRGGKLQSNGAMQLDARSLLNAAGSINSKQQLGLRILELLDNTGGTLKSNGNQQISAEQVDNRQGVFNSLGAFEVTAGQLDNPDGTLISGGNGIYRINVINNQQGKIHGGGTLTFKGETINNQAGQLIATGAMRIDSQTLNNHGQGKITSQDTLAVHSDRVNNYDGGLLLGTTHTEVTARELNNTAGRLQSTRTLTLSNLDKLNNRQGMIRANGTLNLNAGIPSVLALFNQGGLVQSGEQLTVNTRALDNTGGTLLSQQGLTLAVQQDYTHRAGDTISSNGALTFSVGGLLTNLADWWLPGSLTINSAHFTNQGTLAGKILRLTTGTLRNEKRLEADSMTLTSDTLDNTDTVMGDTVTVRSRVIDNHGQNAVIAATERLDLQTRERMNNRDGSLIYSAGTLHLTSDDLIENKASGIEADGDVSIEANRLNNLREGLEIVRGAEKGETQWHRYNYYWRSYASGVNRDKNTMAPTTQRLMFRDDTAVENNRYGTLLAIDAAGKRAQVRVKDHLGQPYELWIHYLALKPGRDGSYDMTFYETRGHRQNTVPTPYHNTVWREHNRGRLEQWDPEKHLDIANVPFVDDYNNFRERSATGTVTRDKLVSEGIGAHILAGGNMTLRITGKLLNDASTVSANGDLVTTGDGEITNRAYSVNERREEFLVDHYDRDTRHWYPEHHSDETVALATIDAIMTGHGDVAIHGAKLENTTVNPAQISVVEAAQKAAEAERAEWARNPLAVTVEGVEWQAQDSQLVLANRLLTPLKRRLTSVDLPHLSDDQLLTLLKRELTPIDQPRLSDDQLLTLLKRELTPADQPLISDEQLLTLLKRELTPADPPLRPIEHPLTPAELALTSQQKLDRVATFVPNNGLFRQHPAEGSPYLVVTDERFTSRTRFISSDYLLQRVGYDPAQVHKRLGDGFYEQRLVREQILKLTGRPSVRGEDAMAQYQTLMNNGTKVANDFRLVPGVALTPAQIAALQQDIVWLVSETVETAGGPQTVWVPKVYLANTTLRLTGQGALIGGGNLQLSANSLTNAGNLFAERALNIDTAQFLHQGGDIRAERIDVQAESLTLSTNLQDALRQASMSAQELSLRGGDIQLRGAKLEATRHLNLSARDNLDITAARSTTTGNIAVIAGAMGNRTSDGMEEAGQRMATVSGEWQQAQGSTLNAGGNLSLRAGQNITLQGSQAKAGGTVQVQAGGNVNLLAETTTHSTQLEANSRTSSVSNRREEDRLHLSTLSGDRGVTLQAGENLTAEGAQVDSRSGHIGLDAQTVIIKEVRQRVADQDSERKREGSTNSRREMESVSEHSVGSTFSGRDGVSVMAREGDITVTGSTLHSEQGALELQAKQDITLNSASESDYQFSASSANKKGVLSKSSSHTVQEDRVTREQGTLLSGDSISITAGNDLSVSGSAVAGDKDVTLQAGNNVAITAATETESHYLLEEKKKSGLLSSGGMGFTVGSQSTRHQVNEDGITQSQSVSTVGSSQGNVNITAGNRVQVGGADLVAGQDISITGDSVQIDPGQDKRRREETFESKQSGLTLALSGTVGSALNTAVSTAQQARTEGDGRLKALKGTQSVLSGAQGYQAWQLSQAGSAKADAINQAGGNAEKPTDTTGIQLSYGSQSAKSETRTEQTQSQDSQLNAGRDIRITAKGDNAQADSGNIQIAGSSLKAGRDVTLDAKRDIVLQSAENTQTTRGENSSQGGSVGVGLTAGQGGYGIKFSASVNKGKGHETDDGVTHSETLIDAGNQVSLKSGQDTTLKGAQVSGEKVTADIGRNLHLQSEQDKDNYDAKQENASAGASFTYGSMSGSASVNASRDKIHSQFESVNEQTGVFAGKGGFDIKVGEHTQLDGAVIASHADKDKNRLETGTLGFSDIENKAEYKSEHQSVGISTGGAVGSQLVSNMASNMLAGTNKSDSKSSTTHAAVSDGTIIVRDADKQKQAVSDLSRDTDNAANSLTPIFDKEKEQRRLAQAQAIAQIGTQVLDIYSTHEAIKATKTATEKLKDPQTQQALKQQAEAQLRQENGEITAESIADRAHKIAYDAALKAQGAEVGGGQRQAVTAVVTVLQGLAGGDIKAAIAGGAAPYLANAVKELTYGGKPYEQLTAEEKATNLVAHAILGGVIAEMKGGSASAGAVGAANGELAASAIAGVLYAGKTMDELSPDEQEKVSNLSTIAGGLAAGLATDSTAGGISGAQTAKNAIENNFLHEDESRRFDKELAECKAKGGDCGAVIQKYLDISNKNSAELEEKCKGGGITCVTYEEIIQANTNVALDEGSLQIRLSEKLKDPDAIKIVQYLNGKDLQFLKDNITTSNRVAAVALDPTSWPVMVFGAKAMIQGAKGKEQLLAAGVTSSVNAAIQYGTTGEVKLSDVIGAGVVGAITAGKSYNPTVTWNAVGGYYTAEIKGDDPFLNAIISKGGASAGYAVGNVIKVPMEKVLNPISKQLEWEPIGIWTITRPVKQSSVPSIAGNVGDSVTSSIFNDSMGQAIKDKEQKNEKK
ncbi:hemagglutinin repeat-containing protein [Xenorhabdus sp. XENO-10]|uniref:Hemagglutinin repeat-containing protein n=1 Tax=Xenorhabdus yunnanensis TaxID=3025878 RepID=A0ABT5LEK0_9GAMM|nr:hemagglutinin repeat-containing protein [Xenorhabdus yunnanensis]MDC9589540.1 hemagglutinin repeat-containing protein [Xenorhabdus yunnanensis]